VLITGLGTTTPNPRGFTAVALVGTPIAAVLTGILEFIILNGTDAFPRWQSPSLPLRSAQHFS
jgi:hypothetical protein